MRRPSRASGGAATPSMASPSEWSLKPSCCALEWQNGSRAAYPWRESPAAPCQLVLGWNVSSKRWGHIICRFTNITRDFKGTLDYILYTEDSLAPGSLLELPEEAEVRRNADS